MCIALWRFWWLRGHLDDGARWLKIALQVCADREPMVCAAVEFGAAVLHNARDEVEESVSLFQQCLKKYRAAEAHSDIARVLSNLGNIAVVQGSLDVAKDMLEEGLRLAPLLDAAPAVLSRLYANRGHIAFYEGERDNWDEAEQWYRQCYMLRLRDDDPLGYAQILINLGNVAYRRQSYAAARHQYEESLTIATQLGNKEWIANANFYLGRVAQTCMNEQGAASHLHASLSWWRQSMAPRPIASLLSGLAWVAHRQRMPDRAIRLWYGAQQAFEAAARSIPASHSYHIHRESLLAAQDEIDHEQWTYHWSEASGTPLIMVVAYALGEAIWDNVQPINVRPGILDR
jgi:tetratricopeptide (TPR) repeat protein